MTPAELDEYDRLLDENDWDLYYWASDEKPAPEQWQKSKLFARVKSHLKNERKQILRMPDL